MTEGDTIQFRDFNDQSWRYGKFIDQFANGFAISTRMRIPNGVTRKAKENWAQKIIFVRQVRTP